MEFNVKFSCLCISLHGPIISTLKIHYLPLPIPVLSAIVMMSFDNLRARTLVAFCAGLSDSDLIQFRVAFAPSTALADSSCLSHYDKGTPYSRLVRLRAFETLTILFRMSFSVPSFISYSWSIIQLLGIFLQSLKLCPLSNITTEQILCYDIVICIKRV